MLTIVGPLSGGRLRCSMCFGSERGGRKVLKSITPNWAFIHAAASCTVLRASNMVVFALSPQG